MNVCFVRWDIFEKARDVFACGDLMDRMEESLELFDNAILIGFVRGSGLHRLRSKRMRIILYPRIIMRSLPSKILNSLFYGFVLFVLLSIYSSIEGVRLIHLSEAFFSGVPAVVFKKLSRRSLMVFIQGSSIDTLRYDLANVAPSTIIDKVRQFMIVIQSFVCHNSDVVVSVSPSCDGAFEDRYGRMPNVIPNGVDLGTYFPQDVTDLRTFLRINDNFAVMYAGRLSREKGSDKLPEIFSKIHDLVPNARFLIVGDGPLKGNVDKHLTQLGVRDLVNFVGRVPHDDMPRMINCADVVLLPSLTEGLPLIIQEAFACGKPVVAADVGGVPEIVRHKENGLLVRQGDIDSMAEAIHFLYKNHDLRLKYGHNGCLLVSSSFSGEACRKKFVLAYKLVLPGAPG